MTTMYLSKVSSGWQWGRPLRSSKRQLNGAELPSPRQYVEDLITAGVVETPGTYIVTTLFNLGECYATTVTVGTKSETTLVIQ